MTVFDIYHLGKFRSVHTAYMKTYMTEHLLSLSLLLLLLLLRFGEYRFQSPLFRNPEASPTLANAQHHRLMLVILI